MFENSRTRLALGALLFAASVACQAPGKGSVSPQGYQSTKYNYSVAARADGTLMSKEWKLDNFYSAYDGGDLIEKTSADYLSKVDFDLDGDGNSELHSEELVYDLRFKHLLHDGRIFIRTFPVSSDLGEKQLTTLMRNYAEAVAGAGYEVVQMTTQDRIVVERRYAASIESEAPAKLAGIPALVATLSVANTEQLKVDPAARAERVELVLMHTKFAYEAALGRGSAKQFPVLFIAGYANQPADFDAGLPEFHELLSRLVIEGTRGFEYAPPSAAAVATPIPEAAAPPPPAAEAPSVEPPANSPPANAAAPNATSGTSL